MGWPIRFRRFRTRLLVLVLGLVATALGATALLVARANRATAIAHIEDNLGTSVRVFRSSVDARLQALADTAKVVSADWPLRTLYLQDELDRRTLRSTLMSYADRLGVPLIATFGLDGDLLTATEPALTDADCGPFRALVARADGEAMDQVGDFAYLRDRLHVLVVVPIYAPRPNIIGWFGAAFPLDDAFARALKQTTLAEVSFVGGSDRGSRRVYATTLEPAAAQVVAAALPGGPQATMLVELAGEPYVTLHAPLGLLGGAPAQIALQRSLATELTPARELQSYILLISLAALVAASLVALVVARGISRPLQQLAQATRQVARGDYAQRLHLAQADEIGQLAGDFNHMTAGLAERDRVRDLLGKVVSPEIASQLLSTELQLGGEEREVTILFADLRDFTSLSEKMTPADLLALLNRYLDRMSVIVEKHGGVIDKYIGDAIMALYGAPVAEPDAAARALATAREMVDALAALNEELAGEGRPPLAFGIGINTARVVAGNMGSKNRLNYSVIGDGVNLAARLETLTKDAGHGTTIIVSESTARAAGERERLRALGRVTVKGRREPVEIFAADRDGPP